MFRALAGHHGAGRPADRGADGRALAATSDPSYDGTQAGPARIRELTATGGFTRFRQAAQTPFNMVLEVRP